MTERFDAAAEGAASASGGPPAPGLSLTQLGVGQGSGQTPDKQENNSFIGFEFPIRWDDIGPNLARASEKKPLDDLVDDLTTRDRLLEDFLNTNVVNGIVAGTNITISRAAGVVTIGTTATQIPPGSIMQYAADTAPSGWLFCNGQVVSQLDYPDLHSAILSTYNTGGEGALNFRLPNLKGRVPVGLDSAQTEFDDLGETGGSKTNTLLDTNLPAHAHSIDHNHGSHTHSIHHDHGLHDHTIDHDHADATGGAHQHGVPFSTALLQNSLDNSAAQPDGSGIDYYNTKSGDGGHTHDIPAFTGTSGDVGISGGGTSGAASVSFTGNSGNGPGTAAAVNNLQPYIVLNYIIKT